MTNPQDIVNIVLDTIQPSNGVKTDMPVTMKMHPADFFGALANAVGKSYLAKMAADAMGNGVVFTLGFNSLTAEWKDGQLKKETVAFPATVPGIMQLQTPKSVVMMTANIVEGLLNKLAVAVPGKAEKQPKVAIELVSGTEDTAAIPVKHGVKPSNKGKTVDLSTRVKLKNASVINQAVYGTGASSTYRVIGLGKVNIAARVMHGKNVSVRAEGNIDTSARAALIELGFQTNDGTYMSAHYDLSEAPVHRILGAILYTKELGLDQRIDSIANILHGTT